MLSILASLSLMGCTTGESAGWNTLFQPVAVQSPVEEDTDDSWDDDSEDEWSLSSDELRASANETADPAEAAAPNPLDVLPETIPATPTVAIATATPATATHAPVSVTPTATLPAVTTQASLGDNTGWPVRLVQTLPDTQPPRAILGLPDGRELVVSPGTLIPLRWKLWGRHAHRGNWTL